MSTIKIINGLLRRNVLNNIVINEIRTRDTLYHQIRGHRSISNLKPHLVTKVFPKPIKSDPEVESLRKNNRDPLLSPDLADLRFAFPEFLPDPVVEYRNKVKDKLMRKDMIRRRNVVDIPEFYVGSVLAITISDPYAPGKISKFVGICIERAGQGTYANFTLRNRVDGQGVEIRYDLYNPTIREIQVLRLEKRVDPHLKYLRDALPEYSTFPFDMTPEPLQAGQPVPVNKMKVVMKPWPWTCKWYRHIDDLKGIAKLESFPDYEYINKWKTFNAHEKYDLMKEYREHVPEEDQIDIWREVKAHEESLAEKRDIARRKRLMQQTIKNQ